jgi:hypothetical protein
MINGILMRTNPKIRMARAVSEKLSKKGVVSRCNWLNPTKKLNDLTCCAVHNF